MAFRGNEGERIDLQTGARWTRNYREAHRDEPNLVKAHFFGRDHFDSILNQPGAVGIRIYHALDDEGKTILVMVGVDANEQDMENGVIVEKSVVCPPYCGSGSLNGR